MATPTTTVVVGAAQGIGATIARRLVPRPGDGRLILADIRADGLAALADELSQGGAKVEAVPTDITDPTHIGILLDASRDATRVALVAGIFQASPSLEVTRSDVERIIGVNLVGTFLVAQRYAAAMLSAEGGTICASAPSLPGCPACAKPPTARRKPECAKLSGSLVWRCWATVSGSTSWRRGQQPLR